MTRHIIRISLVMLLGVVTSVAVAWGCAWTHGHMPQLFDGNDDAVLCAAFVRGDECWNYISTDFGAVTVAVCIWRLHPVDAQPDAPGWSRFHVFGVETMETRHEVASGFPFRCFVGDAGFTFRGPPGMRYSDLQNLIALDDPWARYPDYYVSPRLIPVGPILPGLLANTAIYGGVWWAILFCPGMLIRRRRRCAGRCAKCGYDLR